MVPGYKCEADKNYLGETTCFNCTKRGTAQNVASALACANLCDAQVGCHVFLHNKYKECYLKSDKKRVINDPAKHQTLSCQKVGPSEAGKKKKAEKAEKAEKKEKAEKAEKEEKAEKAEKAKKRENGGHCKVTLVAGYKCECDKNYLGETTCFNCPVKNVPSASACAKLCGAQIGCHVFLHNKYKQCFLKSDKKRVINDPAIHQTLSCEKV